MAIIREFKREDKNEVEKLLEELLMDNKDILFEADHFIDEKNTRCVVAQDEDEIVGYGQILWYRTATKKNVARIEDVVVKESHRGEGIGRELTKKLIDIARDYDVNVIELTSNPQRFEAGRLYESLGFEQRDTRAYRLQIG